MCREGLRGEKAEARGTPHLPERQAPGVWQAQGGRGLCDLTKQPFTKQVTAALGSGSPPLRSLAEGM